MTTPRLFTVSAIFIFAIGATYVSVRLVSSDDPYEFDIAAKCAANPIINDDEALAYLAGARKEHERLGNTEIVAQIDEFLVGWEARQDEEHARVWAEYEEACLPEPKPQATRSISL